ncbi:MAG: hypothetical protein M8350_05780 [Methanosarcinaceae archaeon]|nr:hypothetical protein [Methanosarcinaceae archaeon]
MAKPNISLIAFAVAFVVVLSLLSIASIFNAPELPPSALSNSEIVLLGQIKFIITVVVALGTIGLTGLTLAMHLRLTETLAR